VLHTTDQGNTWDVTMLPWQDNASVCGLGFIDENRGILAYGYNYKASYYSHLCYTENGGRTWIETEIPSGINCPKTLYVFQDGTGYVRDDDNKDYARTTDCGKSWQLGSLPDDVSSFTAFKPYNSSILFVAANKHLFKSSNGGNTWIDLHVPKWEFDDILFRNENEGTSIYRYNGKIFFAHTRDSGKTWINPIELFLDYTDWYGRMRLYKGIGTQVILSGPGGLLMRWDWETGFKQNDFVAQRTKEVPKSAIINAYPNPIISNSSWHLRYQIAKTAQVNVKVYNLNGKLAKTVLDAVRKPGKYLLSWQCIDKHGCSLRSGIYFARVKIGNDVLKTVKLVVIK